MSERQERLALSLMVEPGDPRLLNVLGVYEPGQLVEALQLGRDLPGIRMPQAWREAVPELPRQIAAARARAEEKALRWVVPGDPAWPTALDDLDHLEPMHGCTGRPLGLWVRGADVSLSELVQRSVAIVGARSCTSYGQACASEIAADAADQDYTVVSGAAFGIDAAAHRGALVQDRPTVAVLACGADTDYPQTHGALLERIAQTGLVVSEQAPSAAPLRSRFLSRNRIIAALAGGTVVVEAARRSGSLNTLRWADALGRVTMAVPGPVTSQQSAGAHHAVREGRAVLVTDGGDVLEALGGLGAESAATGPADTARDRLGLLARRVVDCLAFAEGRSTEQLAAAARGSRRDVADLLLGLERAGWCSRRGDRWVAEPRPDEPRVG